jgi:uncharacterized protein YkwD
MEATSPTTPVRTPRRRLRSLAVVLALLFSFGIVATACATPDEESAVSMVNASRRAGGRADLSSNVSLILTAQAWSQQLASDGKLSHRPSLAAGAPDGWRKLGENVGYGNSPQIINNAFDASAPHYANIMDPAFNNVGIGITVDGNGRNWEVQEFAAI